MDAAGPGFASAQGAAVRPLKVDGKPQHFLYFFPEPQGHGSFRLVLPIDFFSRTATMPRAIVPSFADFWQDCVSTMETPSEPLETRLAPTPPQPPWTGLGKKLESIARKAIHEFALLAGVSRLGIALSGGKDSLTLLALLKAISGRGFPPVELIAFHVWGEYSCGASVGGAFITDFCAQLRVPLVRTELKQSKETDCYSCSRRRRKLIFDMAKGEGCSTVAFGHHRDDNAQTFLMNVFHKGECAGLLPKIHLITYGVTIVRPLILMAEADIARFAKQYGFQRLACRCPIGQNSMRKQVDRLLGELEGTWPNARSNIAQASLQYGSSKAQLSSASMS